MPELPLPTDRSHSRYARLWSKEREGAVNRKFVQEMYSRCSAYLDGNLPRELPEFFPSRLWELCVATMLLDSDVDLCPTDRRPCGDQGPDLLFADGTTWVEAVSVNPGTGADALAWPTDNLGTTSYIPDEAIILRLLQGIDAKLNKIRDYLKLGVVGRSDRFVIALNSREVPWASKEQGVPRILRALFPIGPLEVRFDVSSGDVAGSSYSYRPEIKKAKGSVVPATLFLSPESASISAVLYSCIDEYNRPAVLTDAMTLVHNPSASNSLANGALPRGIEYIAHDGVIEMVDHRAVGR